MKRGWGHYRMLRAMDQDAAEKGRLTAAHVIASDPEARQRVEDAFGLEFCAKMYPEAYRSGFMRILDRARQAIGWS
jgi:hypothetical protein